jgi:hypothetical protein
MNLSASVTELRQQLADGIIAVASIQQFNEQQKRLADIKSDVTMK